MICCNDQTRSRSKPTRLPQVERNKCLSIISLFRKSKLVSLVISLDKLLQALPRYGHTLQPKFPLSTNRAMPRVVLEGVAYFMQRLGPTLSSKTSGSINFLDLLLAVHSSFTKSIFLYVPIELLTKKVKL